MKRLNLLREIDFEAPHSSGLWPFLRMHGPQNNSSKSEKPARFSSCPTPNVNLLKKLLGLLEPFSTLAIDNNFAERAMRPIAIGRKNWLFVGSEAAGHRAAILTSLIASCKNNFVDPWAYLKDVLTKLPHKPQQHELIELLPDRWLKLNSNKRWEIAEIRKAERQKKM